MTYCTKCQFRFSVHDAPPRFCPRCGAEAAASEPQISWTSIARLTSLAEVGYFADLLEAEGTATQVRHHHEFSAVDGSWQEVFILQVRAGQSCSAAQRLHQEIQRTADDAIETMGQREESGRFGLRSDPATAITSFWKPVMLVIVAGGLLYTARHVNREGPRPTAEEAASLWRALTETSRVYLTDEAAEGGGARLFSDRRSRSVWLEEDIDGDGRIDRLRCFREGELIDEVAR